MTRVTITEPTVGGDSGTWGTKMNTALTALQTAINALGTYADTNLPTDTGVKTGAYTAAVGDIVRCDATSGTFAVTLPSAPAVGSRIIVKKIDASANTVTITRGGSDVFNATGGSTTLTLTYQFQSVTLQYTTGIWIVVASDTGSGVVYTNSLVKTTLQASSASNTTADTTLGTAATIAASALTVGSLIRVVLDGNFDSIASGGIFSVKIKANGTTVATVNVATSQTAIASGLTWALEGRLYVDATGAGGSVSFHDVRYSRTAAAAIITTPDQAVGVAVDLSGGLAVTVAASMATANASNVLRLVRGAVTQIS